DLLVANGHPDDKVEEHYAHVKYREPLLLFHNTGGRGRRVFDNVSAQAGPPFQQQFAARGLAIGDYDNDGAVDVLVAVNNGGPQPSGLVERFTYLPIDRYITLEEGKGSRVS